MGLTPAEERCVLTGDAGSFSLVSPFESSLPLKAGNNHADSRLVPC